MKGRALNELQTVLDQCLALLAEGVADANSPWRTPALATVHASGPPGIRTIVLRSFDPAARIAALHTDARSPKMTAIRTNPAASLHGWDAARRIQLRLDGAIAIADDTATNAAWAALPAQSRATYSVALSPGTEIPDADRTPPALPDAEARKFFTVLHLHVTELEYLSLAHGAHRRARFRWSGGALVATWLAP